MFRRIKKIIKKGIAAGLAVWLSGVVFLFCCEKTNAQPEADFCPLAKMSSHCDKKAEAAKSDSIERSGPPCFDCCGFLPVVFDKGRKIEPAQKQFTVSSAVERPRQARVLVGSNHEFSPISQIARVPDRHETYLINRIFRI